MGSFVARPTFYEGEILPAADLVASVNYPRGALARHERYLHVWGIASGLTLATTSMTQGSTPYVQVTLKAGIAIDGSGRELVVPTDTLLDPSGLASFGPEERVWYPVFINGVDQSAPATSNPTGCGNVSQSTSTQETCTVSYGMPGSAQDLAEQAASNYSDGAGSGSWTVLVGFVEWSSAAQQFSGVAYTDGTTSVQYAGAAASEVVSQNGSLLLATHPAGTTGANPVMGLQIQETSKGSTLLFGQLNSAGNITVALLKVSSSGDLTVTGQISGAVAPGSVQVQSGIAYDGMTLPPPPGVNLSAGNSAVQTHVSVHYDNLVPPPGLTIPVPIPLECRVDESTLQVHCQLQWFDLKNPSTPIIAPASCDYMVIVSAPAS